MKQIQQAGLSQIAGGVTVLLQESDAVSGVDNTAWGGGGDGGFGGDMLGAGGSSNNGYDSNGVGPTNCVPAPAAAPLAPGLFGYTLTETLGGASALAGLAVGVGQGVGASMAIETAGGLAGVGAMESGAASLMGSAGLGLASAFATGYTAGTLAYNGSDTVQDVSQAIVGRVTEVAPDIPAAIGTALVDVFHGKGLGRAGVGP